MIIKPSKYQQDILKTYRTTDKNIVIQACPGSGKTTTLIELLKLTPKFKKVVFLAFNKSIVDELKKRIVRTDIEISTLHSLGLKALYRKYNGMVEISEYKNFKLLQNFKKKWGIENDKKGNGILFNISKLVDNIKIYDLKPSEANFNWIADKHSILCISNEIEMTMGYWKYLKTYNNANLKNGQRKLVDYPDMIYLAIQNYFDLPIYDEVFVDEIQDLNIIQQKLIEHITSKKGGRVIAVGDKYQAIYSFMGADIAGFNKFEKKENTIVLPLSVSYRCPKLICEKANKIYNNIESKEGAENGEVIELGSYKEIKEGDFALCRNNLPLLEFYLLLLKQGKKSFIKDKNLGQDLINLISIIPYDCELNEGMSVLEKKLEEITLSLKEKGVKNIVKNPKYVDYKEKILIIEHLAKHYGNFNYLYEKLEQIYDENGEGITLMTIHKSKGLEADNVYILRKELIPSKYAVQEWEKEQERNLEYVMITRARKKLVYICDF